MKELFGKEKYKNLIKLISTAKRAVIVIHKNPDGDAVGSAVALKNILETVNLRTKIVAPNDFPDFLKWMDGSKQILIYNPDKTNVCNEIKLADLIFCLDFNNPSRVEILEKTILQASAKKILIDHHMNPSDKFDLTFSYHPISSTSELVYRIGKKILNGKSIDKNAAEAIYCGMMTDSGAFSHSSSYPDFFKIIAELLDFGADKDKITQLVYNNFTENRMKLLGLALSKIVVLQKYSAAYITLSNSELIEFNHQIGDTEGFVNYPLSINNIVLSVLFIEKGDHIKMSLRSVGNFDVNDLAQKYFNGGGHKNAAGGNIFCKLTECGKKLEEILKEYEKSLSSN